MKSLGLFWQLNRLMRSIELMHVGTVFEGYVLALEFGVDAFFNGDLIKEPFP